MDWIHFVCLISLTFSAFVSADMDGTASSALNEFSIKLLSEASKQLSSDSNVVLSPYTVWIALSILNEGAGDNTAVELGKVLGTPMSESSRESFRTLQQQIVKSIAQDSDGITIDVANDIYTQKNATLNTTYQDLVQKIYNTKIESLDFEDTAATAEFINSKISNVTRGRIPKVVSPRDIEGAVIFITSALFFKGLWEHPFKVQGKMPFYNEKGEHATDATMMKITQEFRYGTILGDQAEVVELPYKGQRLSMIIIIPKSDSLSSLLRSMTQTTFAEIMNSLEDIGDVEVLMPKFKISTNVELSTTLQKMGIRDVFGRNANLEGIAPEGLYVTSVSHNGEIEVDEEGTVAAGATKIKITFLSFQIPTRVLVNKPFSFFIYDKQTKSVLFLGRVKNPSAASNSM